MYKDFLGLARMSRAEIEALLDRAASFKSQWQHAASVPPLLEGWTVATVFYEPSTRTQVSFDLAARRLGARTVDLQVSRSSVVKGESLVDTVRTLERLGADILVMRHPAAGAPHAVARRTRASVVNAGDGAHEHPTQALLDLLTVRERLGSLEGRHIAIVGDVRHSRVARSDLWGFTRLGARVTLVGPPPLVPRELAGPGVAVAYDLDSVLPEVDVIYVLRIQKERQGGEFVPAPGAYRRRYGLDGERIARLPRDVLILHPGPANVGLEITGAALEDPRSAVGDQVTNGVAVRMAVLAAVAEAQVEGVRVRAIPA